MISIIDFELQYAPDFKQLNLEWLNKYGLTETADLVMLNNPQSEIIDGGGYIFLAKQDDEIIGSAALIKESATRYELAKMAVTSAFQGRGVSKLLMQVCMEKAGKVGAKTVYLSSNSQLSTAVKLYEKFGFKHIAVTDSHYVTADVMMELSL